MESERDLAKVFLTVEDFLNQRNPKNPDLIEMDFEWDKITLNFCKPGFDLAFILSDRSLFCEIRQMQKLLQTKFGLITHCILLSNELKLPLLVKELKLKEIQYAIYIQKHSVDRNEFDLYVLYPYIEVQQLMTLADLINMITDDMRVKKESIDTTLNGLGDPHEKHNTNEGFVPMSNDIRYFLCLLFDGRMVNLEELQTVKNYLLVRRKALEHLQSTDMKFNRPLEATRQQPSKYYFYDPVNARQTPANLPNSSISVNSCITPNLPMHHNQPHLPSSSMHNNQPHLPSSSMHNNQPLLPSSSLPSNPQMYQNPSHLPSSSIPSMYNNQPLLPSSSIPSNPQMYQNQSLPISSISANLPETRALKTDGYWNSKPVQNQPDNNYQNATISAAPVAYGAKLNSTQPNSVPKVKPTAHAINYGKPPVGTPIQASALPPPRFPIIATTMAGNTAKQSEVPLPSNLKPVLVKTNEKTIESSTTTPASNSNAAKSKEHVSIAAQSFQNQKIRFMIGNNKVKDAPVTFNALDKDNNENKALSPIKYVCSPVSPPSDKAASKTSASSDKPSTQKLTDPKNIMDLTSSDNSEVSSPAAGQGKRKVALEPSEVGQIAMNLMNKLNAASTVSDEPETKIMRPDFYSIDISDTEMDETLEESCKIRSLQVVNLFKLILELAQYNLPDNNVVSKMLQTSCENLQKKIPDTNLRNIAVNYQICFEQGFVDIITSIHNLCDDVTPNLAIFSDLDFAWARFFPSQLSDSNLQILFYKLIKLLITYKVFNQFQDTMLAIANIINRISQILDFDFDMDLSIRPKGQLQCLPQLFSIYYSQCQEFHTHTPTSVDAVTKAKMVNDKKYDKMIMSAKIKFHAFPVFNYFVNTINSLHNQMTAEQFTVVQNSLRTLRHCLRRVCPIISLPRINPPKTIDPKAPTMKPLINCIIAEIEKLINEIKKFKPVIFSEKHYEFINCILDCCIKMEKQVSVPSDWFELTPRPESIFHLDVQVVLSDFINTHSEIQLPYHIDTDLITFRLRLRSHWKSLLGRALRGFGASGGNNPAAVAGSISNPLMSGEPDGNRMQRETKHLLPHCWQSYTLDEAVAEAADLHAKEWTRLARDEPKNSMLMFQQSRYAGLIWMEKHGLPLRRALDELSKVHQTIDQAFLEHLSTI